MTDTRSRRAAPRGGVTGATGSPGRASMGAMTGQHPALRPTVEYKALHARAVTWHSGPDIGSVAPEGVVEWITATGVRDDVADIIMPGAFRRTIANGRRPPARPCATGSSVPRSPWKP